MQHEIRSGKKDGLERSRSGRHLRHGGYLNMSRVESRPIMMEDSRVKEALLGLMVEAGWMGGKRRDGWF